VLVGEVPMYPVSVDVTPQLLNRNRLTTAFRLILAIPHLILVGGFGFGIATSRTGGGGGGSISGEGGLLGAVAVFLAIVSWFTIIFGGTHIAGIRQFTMFYLRWRVRAIAYFMLFSDTYPPFGDGPYPASINMTREPVTRDRLSVALRLFLALPHILLLVFVLIAWCVTTVIAWFAILFTGTYPDGLVQFGIGTLRWRLRVEAYLLLMTDDYPPFSFSE
jgi:hypothetical protein